MEKYKLGTREIVAIILITIGTKFTDTTPNLLFPKTYMATWMIPLISAGMFIVPLLILLKLLNKYQLGLVDLIKKLTGKVLGTMFCIMIFIFSLVGTALLMANYAHILAILYFPQTPDIVLLIILAVVSFLVACGGAYTVGRSALIVVPYVKIALGFLLVLAIVEGLDTAYLFPIFGKGLDVVVKESFIQNSIFAECMILATLIPFMKKGEQYSKAAIISLIIVSIEMSVFFLAYIMVFDAYSLENIFLPFQHLTRVVELGRFISNFEGYFLAFWLVASLIKFAIYLFIITLLLTQTFDIKSTQFHLIPITMLIVLIGMLPENIIKASFWYRDANLYFGSLLFLFLPFLLWVLSYRKKVRIPS